MKLNNPQYSFDVVVIGAGIAGVSAAVKAASLGANVVL
ncbi:MAG: FAD-dependent oxidoreductase, partial [Ignavibacteria bacterium]|nr:FAD-dependent oxidoreductase [Ignavibacteria bacterium]